MVQGTKILTYSADKIEEYESGANSYEKGKTELWLEKHLGEKAVWNILLFLSVVISIVLTVGIFIILPTWLVNVCSRFTQSEVLLNLIEGVLRILMFVVYVLLISQMKDIKRVFQYHGAEHKTIHCFENGLELTPENAQQFYTLHPRCGTSFLMFVYR